MIPAPDPERVRWVALSLVPGLGRRALDRLLAEFGSLAAILAADSAALQAVAGIGPRLAGAIGTVDLARTAAALTVWEAHHVTLALRGAPEYPAVLRPLPDAPPLLFALGTVAPEDARAVALVGTRRPTPSARAFAAQLAEALARRGWTIVSGLAAGIDTAAHEGALAAGGRTLAVLGSGVSTIYPPENQALAARITAHGALLSEVAPDADPSRAALVARNRLISGLSRAVIVVETGEDGGSMHAARFARVQGRALYAVRNGSPGTARLIAEGAHALPPDTAAIAPLLDQLDRSEGG